MNGYAETAQLPSPAPNSRVACIGPTQCGKTTLMRYTLGRMNDVIVIDPKYRWDWELPGERYAYMAHTFKELVEHLLEIERKGTGAPVVYRPPLDDLQQRNIAKLDRVYELAFTRGGTFVYNDEQYFATPYTSSERATNSMPWWFRCITAGAALGVGVGASFQRLTNVPLITMTETDMRIVFNMRMEADQARAQQLCGAIDWEKLRRNHHSFVWATDMYCSKPVRLLLRQSQHQLTA